MDNRDGWRPAVTFDLHARRSYCSGMKPIVVSSIIVVAYLALGLGCASSAKAPPKDGNVVAEAATERPPEPTKLSEPEASEAEQIDYSNRLVDPSFETQILAPYELFRASIDKDGSQADDSALVCRGKRKGEVMVGRWTCKSGKRRVLIVSFSNGEKSGWMRSWNEKRKLASESWWRKDVLAGVARSFYDNGVRSIAGGYRVGLRHGLFVKFDEAGKKIAEVTYEGGKRDGRTRVFYPSGKLKFRIQYSDDLPNGKYWSWYENGNIKAHGFMRSGRAVGKWSFWDPSQTQRTIEHGND